MPPTEKEYNLQRRGRMIAASEEFARKVAGMASVREVLLFGSLASDVEYPKDYDIAVFLDGLSDIEAIARCARQMSPMNHNWDAFIFSKDKQFMGNICAKRECLHESADCSVPSCGQTRHLRIYDSFNFTPHEFLISPYKILLAKEPLSIFESCVTLSGSPDQKNTKNSWI